MYFEGRGRGEIARYVFALAGVSYEDRRIGKDEWMRLKPSIPTGTLPALQIDGIDGYLTQSMSIARYLANEFDLAGQTNWERAIVDMVCDTASDLTNPVSLIYFQETDPAKKKQLLEKYISEDLPKIYRLVEAHMKSDFILGKKASLADAAVYYIIEFSRLVDPDCGSRSAKVKLLCSNFEQLPTVSQWLHMRPWTSW